MAADSHRVENTVRLLWRQLRLKFSDRLRGPRQCRGKVGGLLSGRESGGTPAPRWLSAMGRRSVLSCGIGPQPRGSGQYFFISRVEEYAASYRRKIQDIITNILDIYIGQTGNLERGERDEPDTSDTRNPDPGRVLRAGAADRALDALAPREAIEHVARSMRDRQRHHPIDDRLRAVALQQLAVRPGVARRHRSAGAGAGIPGAGVLCPIVARQWLCDVVRGDRAASAGGRQGARGAGHPCVRERDLRRRCGSGPRGGSPRRGRCAGRWGSSVPSSTPWCAGIATKLAPAAGRGRIPTANGC